MRENEETAALLEYADLLLTISEIEWYKTFNNEIIINELNSEFYEVIFQIFFSSISIK